MNKRKINNCGIQTSKRPDADIGKDEVMGRDAAIGTWNVDTDMGKEDKDRTIGDDNSGTTIPLGAFPKKIQEMAKVLVEYENYNQDYLLVSMLLAVATAIGNTCQIRIKGCWTSSPILYAGLWSFRFPEVRERWPHDEIWLILHLNHYFMLAFRARNDGA